MADHPHLPGRAYRAGASTLSSILDLGANLPLHASGRAHPSYPRATSYVAAADRPGWTVQRSSSRELASNLSSSNVLLSKSVRKGRAKIRKQAKRTAHSPGAQPASSSKGSLESPHSIPPFAHDLWIRAEPNDKLVRTSLGRETFTHGASEHEQQRMAHAGTGPPGSPPLKISQGASPRRAQPLHRYAHLEKKNRKLLFPAKQKQKRIVQSIDPSAGQTAAFWDDHRLTQSTTVASPQHAGQGSAASSRVMQSNSAHFPTLRSSSNEATFKVSLPGSTRVSDQHRNALAIQECSDAEGRGSADYHNSPPRRAGIPNLSAPGGSHSGLFDQPRTSASLLFKHSLQPDPRPGVASRQPAHLYITNENYESRFDAASRSDASASSRRYSTKQSHALLTQSTSSRIRDMREEQRLAGVSNVRLFRFFEEQNRVFNSKIDTRRTEAITKTSKTQQLRQKQAGALDEAFRNKHAANFSVTGRKSHECAYPLHTALPQQHNDVLNSEEYVQTQLHRAVAGQKDVAPTTRKLHDVLQMSKQLTRRRTQNMDAVLDSFAAEAGRDYVEGAQKLDAQPPEIEAELKKIDKKQPTKRVFLHRPSDFEVLRMPKLKATYDHSGYLLTASGYKIDSYTLPVEEPPLAQLQAVLGEGPPGLPKRQKTVAIAENAAAVALSKPSIPTGPLKPALLRPSVPSQELLRTQQGYRTQALHGQGAPSEPVDQASRGEAGSAERRRTVIRLQAARERNQQYLPLLQGAAGHQTRPKGSAWAGGRGREYSDASTHHMFDSRSDRLSTTLDYGGVARRIPQVEAASRAAAQAKEGQWSAIQLRNLEKVLLQPNLVTDRDELALAEFIRVTHTDGLQLPFGSILDCVRTSARTGKCSFRVSGQLSEAAARGIRAAIPIFDRKFEGIKLEKVGLGDSGVAMVIQGAIDAQIPEFSFKGVPLGPLSLNLLLDYFKSDRHFVRKLDLEDCKVQQEHVDKLLQAMVLQRHEAEEQLHPIPAATLAPTPASKAPGQDESPPKQRGSSASSASSQSPRAPGVSSPRHQNRSGSSSPGEGLAAEAVIPKVVKVRTLRLRNIKLQTCDKVLKLVRHALRLRKLDLAYNQLKRNQVASLALGLGVSQTLKCLDLSHNPISGQGGVVPTLAGLVQYSISLLDLNLSYTHLCNAPDQLELIHALSKSQSLQALHFDGNQVKSATLDQARLILKIRHANIHRRQETPIEAEPAKKTQALREREEPAHARGAAMNVPEARHGGGGVPTRATSFLEVPDGEPGAGRGNESMKTGRIQAGGPTPSSRDSLHRPKTQGMPSSGPPHYQQQLQQPAEAGARGFDPGFDSLANERLVFMRSLQSESCFSRLGGQSSWVESDECWICHKHQHVVFLYEVEAGAMAEHTVTDVTQRISVPFRGDQFSRKVELFAADVLLVDSITADDVAIDAQVKGLLRQESSRKRRLAHTQQKSDASERIEQMTPLKKLRAWIRRKAETHNLVNTVKFAEFPVECDDASREGLATTWYAGMHIVKPNVKFSLAFACRAGRELVREDTFDYTAAPRALPVRTELLSMVDLANLSAELATHVTELGSSLKAKKRSGPRPAQQPALTPTEQAEGFAAFGLLRYSELLDESVLRGGRLYLKLLLDEDEKEGRVRRASEQDLEASGIEHLIDARYEQAAMTDLAVAEFKKQLLEYYPYITALYAECVALGDAESYPVVREAEVLAVAEKYGLVNRGTRKAVRREIITDLVDEVCAGWRALHDPLEASEPARAALLHGQVRRCHFVEIIARLAAYHHPRQDLVLAFKLYCHHYLTRASEHHFRVFEQAKSYQVDWVLDKRQDTVQRVLWLLKIAAGVWIQRARLLELFDTLFPQLKAEIRVAYVKSQTVVNDQAETDGNSHAIDVQDFYEFMVRLSILVVGENIPTFISLDIVLQQIQHKLEQEKVQPRSVYYT